MSITDETCFVVGNGESRKIFGNLDRLQGHGTIYGCNAIYRDWPNLCDKIFAMNPDMYNEVVAGKENKNFKADVLGLEQISDWNYIVESDPPYYMPDGLKIYRTWTGMKPFSNVIKSIDFSNSRGSGCSAVLHAAEQGFKNIFIIAFDILGAQQWEQDSGKSSRIQNNIYAGTVNYPDRKNMKAYLKYEWMFQLTQIARNFSKQHFYFINRKEYITDNHYLPYYVNHASNNFNAGIYAELNKFILDPSVLENKKLKWIL